MNNITAFIHLDMFIKDGDAKVSISCHGKAIDLIVLLAQLRKDNPILFKEINDPTIQKIVNLSELTSKGEVLEQ